MLRWQRSAVGTAHAFVVGDDLSLCRMYIRRPWVRMGRAERINRCKTCAAYSRKGLRYIKIIAQQA